MDRAVAVVCTMDTKGDEAEFLKAAIESHGSRAVLMDVSTRGEPRGTPDITSDEIVARAGLDRAALRAKGVRGDIVAAMADGAALTIADLLAQERIQGALGIGGNQGSAIAATAMRALPIGFPKFLVSTIASGNIRPFVGHKDIAVMFSVSDFVGGLNPVTRSILANAAAAVTGMAASGAGVYRSEGRRTIAVTALGNTEAAAHKAIELLQAAGHEVVAFHASGAGGSAMEELIRNGTIDAVLDLTLHELTEEVLGVGAYVPVTPGRLSVALDRGIPVVAATGGMEYLCFGPRSSIPEELQDRTIYMHNPYNANLKINHEELVRVAEVLAERLNAARSSVALFIPRKAWSVYGGDGGPFHDPEGIELFLDTVRHRLQDTVELTVMDSSINDEEFAEACVAQLNTYLASAPNATPQHVKEER